MPSRRVPSVAVLALTASLAVGCDDGGDVYSLPSGRTVEVAENGGLAIRDGRTVLFAIDAPHAITGTTFDPSITYFNGFFTFDETNEARTELDRLVDVVRESDTVISLHYASRTSPATATLRVDDAGAGPDATVTVTLEGIDGLDAIEVPTRCDSKASFLGFGAQYNATNQRGEAFPLWVEEQGIGRQGVFVFQGNAHTTYFPMPYFLDARGFGRVYETDARVVVDLCNADPEVARFRVEDGAPLSIVLLSGGTPREVVRRLGDRYGRSRRPPDWAFRPWIGIQGGQARVLAEADALDAASVPWVALWAQDWVGYQAFGLGLDDIQYHWNVDATLYPDLRGLTDTLHGRGKRFLGYANSFVEQGKEHFAPMDSMGLLIRGQTGTSYVIDSFRGPTSLPDLTLPAANSYVDSFLRAMVTVHGMDGWMADFGEWLPTDAVLSNGVDARLEHNRYPRRWQALNLGALEATRGNDFVMFTRSGSLGSQATTQVVWIGDQEADFLPGDGLPTVMPALLNLGLSGIPYVTHDIAGYSGGPSTKELFQRWTELGAFTPIMRTHEGLRARDNWRWNSDAETLVHFRRFARIHEALIPTFLALADEADATSMPILRHLVLAFPDDPAVRSISDEMMLGDELLVAPVTEQGATSREVYLPAGRWYHVFREGEVHEGPARVTVDAPIGVPPVFSLGRDRPDLRAIE